MKYRRDFSHCYLITQITTVSSPGTVRKCPWKDFNSRLKLYELLFWTVESRTDWTTFIWTFSTVRLQQPYYRHFIDAEYSMVQPINDNGIHGPSRKSSGGLSMHFSNMEGKEKSWIINHWKRHNIDMTFLICEDVAPTLILCFAE